MACKLDRILVVDVEATCWEGDPPPGQISEAESAAVEGIEIGLCVLDAATWRVSSDAILLVRPVCSTVSPYCRQLTTLTQAHLGTIIMPSRGFKPPGCGSNFSRQRL